MAEKKFYVVWEGVEPGIYGSWSACQAQIKGYSGARYKSFKSRSEAEAAFNNSYESAIVKKSSKNLSSAEKAKYGSPIQTSVSVDAACAGNPGKLEYQGVYTKDKAPLFHMGPFPEGTVNIGEFLAIVHALALLHKQGSTLPIYSDSRTAMKWVRDKRVNTKLPRNAKNGKLFELVSRAEKWLRSNDYTNQVLKWETKAWGEIPADFGRK